MEENAGGEGGVREFTVSRDNLSSCAVAILLEFEAADTVRLRAVGSAINTLYRISKLFERHGAKVIKTERETFREGSKERFILKVTLQRNVAVQ